MPNSRTFRNLIAALLVLPISPVLVAQTQISADERLLFTVKEHTGQIDEAIAAGANPNAKFPDGTSVLQFILREDPFSMGIKGELYLLLKKGASIEGLNQNDSVRLYHFVLRMSIHVPGDHIGITSRDDKDHPEIGKQMLERMKPYNLNVNSRDSEGNTPLMLAVVTPTEAEYIEWLLKNGADANLRNGKNQMAHDIFRASVKSYKEGSAEDGGFEGEEEYRKKNEGLMKKAEQILAKATKAPNTDATGVVIGKVFSIEGKKIEITGHGIAKLIKGQKLTIKTSDGIVKATVTETLHTKVKAKITGKGAVEKGNPVRLSR
jgi:hypothetical protein